MNPLRRLAEWFDVRPNEVRAVVLSFLGAFLVIGFLILAKSLREAFYLTLFDVRTLPYITVAVAVASVPTIGLFARLMARHDPHRVLNATLAIEAVGLLVLWRIADQAAPATVAFYLWTAIGALLITSGFWIVTAEHFALRGAKRLFGLIGAGGTAGAMVMGNSLAWVSSRVPTLIPLVPGLVVLLLLFFVTQALMPHSSGMSQHPVSGGDTAPTSVRESFRLVWQSPHLRTLALIVFSATAASTLLDFQFKALAQQSFTTPDVGPGAARQLASFFGTFYGWAGAVALVLQLALTSRLMSRAGVAGTVSVLPAAFLLGAIGVLLLPSLAMVTLARGGVYTLRKSLYRSALEVLYVPLPTLVRRKTKTFIDSTVDAIADGWAAVLIFLLVTLLGMPSRYLSVIIAAVAVHMLFLSRRVGREYFRTLTGRLVEERDRAGGLQVDTSFDRRDLLSASFTRIDLRAALVEAMPERPRRQAGDRAAPDAEPAATDPTPREADALLRDLARDSRYWESVERLVELGEGAEETLVTALVDPATDFVIRRRIPAVLARAGGAAAEDALLDVLTASRFEVRYRAALALVRRRKQGLPTSTRDWEPLVWEAVRRETGRDRPVWELQRLLDGTEEGDELVSGRIGVRGELSLEHTFRLLSLVLDAQHVRSAFQGIVYRDEQLRNFALEYLEHVLPADVRARLWPFIGDESEQRQERQIRSLDNVVNDLIETGATLFGTAESRAALRRMLEDQEPNAE